MDSLITYDEAAEFLKNPPSLSPRPGFANMRALRKHMVTALKQLVCPQSAVHGWTGMVLSPMVYALLEPTAFAIPGNPGPVAVYNQFATPAAIKTADNLFKRLQNEHQSYENIRRACFRMLDSNIADQFKVSNVPTRIGWNQSMSIIDIIDQLNTTYGKPDTITLLHNDTLFRSAFNPEDAPELLFYRIEQCQEIQVLGRDPYSDTQIINNTVRLWMQENIFPLKEFKDWEEITPKTYTALKTFIAGAFTRQILAQQLRRCAFPLIERNISLSSVVGT